VDATVTIIGAGQAGLAMSHCLSSRSIDHIVLERGDTANSWRRERWDSLRLLTPNWLSRLPGFIYDGPDPDGFMLASQVADYLDRYRVSCAAPVQIETSVENVESVDGQFKVTSNRGVIMSLAVVVASGACSTPHTPAAAASFPSTIQQLAPIRYRNPAQIADGRVLVVGASASGAQIADELARSGRDVILAVGSHTRVPRSYRGMDIHWWMDTIGVHGERWNEVDDIVKARRAPSLQLVGSPDARNIDLNHLTSAGVNLVGRLAGVAGSRAQFSGSLANIVASADLKQNRLLDRIDEYATQHGLDHELGLPHRHPSIRLPTPQLELDLRTVGAVVWATGFRPSYPWLPETVLDHRGAIRHDGGVMHEPGMYVLGLPFMRRRKSAFLDGVGQDAIDLSTHLVDHLDRHSSITRCAR
jgi:putative flavoprotein involved in K+ transport